MSEAEIVELATELPFETVVERITHAIEAAGMTIFARIDHAAGARGVGLEMPPTLLLVYGNPRGGTPVMLAAPRTALDLPLRVLIRSVGPGKAVVAYHPALAVLGDAGVPEALLEGMAKAQAALARAIEG